MSTDTGSNTCTLACAPSTVFLEYDADTQIYRVSVLVVSMTHGGDDKTTDSYICPRVEFASKFQEQHDLLHTMRFMRLHDTPYHGCHVRFDRYILRVPVAHARAQVHYQVAEYFSSKEEMQLKDKWTRAALLDDAARGLGEAGLFHNGEFKSIDKMTTVEEVGTPMAWALDTMTDAAGAEGQLWRRMTFALTLHETPETAPTVIFHTCNGLQKPTDVKDVGGEAHKEDMWRKLLASGGAHVQLGGGDQLYNDSVLMREGTHLDQWKPETHGRPSTKLARLILELYMHNYLRHWAMPFFGAAAARTPALFAWDDHDIVDGWGSYNNGFETSPLGRHIFACGTSSIKTEIPHAHPINCVASAGFCLLQHHVPPPDWPQPQPLPAEPESVTPSTSTATESGPEIAEASRESGSTGKDLPMVGQKRFHADDVVKRYYISRQPDKVGYNRLVRISEHAWVLLLDQRTERTYTRVFRKASWCKVLNLLHNTLLRSSSSRALVNASESSMASSVSSASTVDSDAEDVYDRLYVVNQVPFYFPIMGSIPRPCFKGLMGCISVMDQDDADDIQDRWNVPEHRKELKRVKRDLFKLLRLGNKGRRKRYKKWHSRRRRNRADVKAPTKGLKIEVFSGDVHCAYQKRHRRLQSVMDEYVSSPILNHISPLLRRFGAIQERNYLQVKGDTHVLVTEHSGGMPWNLSDRSERLKGKARRLCGCMKSIG
ncbi:MAG: hypothetical protein MHM6MM_006186 [Cercozoa sp. M6MM]